MASPSLARSPAMHEGFHLRDWKVMTIMKILRLFYYDYDDDTMAMTTMIMMTVAMMTIFQVERTPVHTPSSPPLSSYAVAAPLLSSEDEEDDDEDEHFVEDNEKEDFVEEEESEPMSRWV